MCHPAYTTCAHSNTHVYITGCGKSVLLKLLANQLHAGRVKGNVTFNGLVPDRDTHHSSVAFVQQADVHFGNVEVFPLPAKQVGREWCVDL